ncbi:MAG: hypothetical protein ACRC06_05030 [Waterburya sp.]
MLNKITSKELAVTNFFNIKIDRILVFVKNINEIKAFRALHLYYFEFVMRNLEPGIISSIFFLRGINLELVWIKNQELACVYAAQRNLNLDFRVQQQLNQAVPFAFILSYSSTKKSESKRRCYHTGKQEIGKTQLATQVNFSSENLKNIQEPTCYIVPESLTSENFLDNSSVIKRKLLSYQSQNSRLTDIRVILNSPELPSKAISLISSLELIKIKRGKFLKLELIFNESEKRQFSLTSFSSIPITFYY